MCTQEYTQPEIFCFLMFLLFSRFFPALARYTKQRNFFLPKSPHSGPAAVTS